MDFIDRMITRCLENNSTSVVKPQQQALFETTERMFAVVDSQKFGPNAEESTPTSAGLGTLENHTIQTRWQSQGAIRPQVPAKPDPPSPHFYLDEKTPAVSPTSPTQKFENHSHITLGATRVTSSEPLVRARRDESDLAARQSFSLERTEDQEVPDIAAPTHFSERKGRQLSASEYLPQGSLMPLLIPNQEPIRQRVEKSPLVNIAIGRIELHTAKSVAPQPVTVPKRSVSTANPVRSLHDYLSSRNRRSP